MLSSLILETAILVDGEVCYVGKQSLNSQSWTYTLTPSDPCDCTSLVLTGKTKEDIILSSDINAVRKYLGDISCPGRYESTPTCTE